MYAAAQLSRADTDATAHAPSCLCCQHYAFDEDMAESIGLVTRRTRRRRTRQFADVPGLTT